MFRKYYIILLSLLLATPIFAQEQINLSRCIEIALKNNPALKIKATDLRVAGEEVKQAGKDLLPSLGFSGSYRRQSAIPEVQFPAITSPFGGAPISLFPSDGLQLGSLDTYDFKFTVQQPLFTGFRLKNRKFAADAQKVSKQHDFRKAKSELIFNVEKSYAGVLKAQKVLEIAKTGKEQVNAHLQDVQNYVAQGMARKAELLAVRVKAAEAELAVVRAENGVRLAVAALENILGSDLKNDINFVDVDLPISQETEIETSVQRALDNREEIKSLNFSLQAANTAIKIVKGGRLPAMSAFASYGYGRPGLNFVKNEWMDYWIVGVGMNWELWNWGKTGSKIEQAKLISTSVTDALQQAKLAIKFQVTQACLSVQEAKKRIQLSEDIEKQAEESFRVTENSYRQGQATNTEYLDAQLELTRARLRKADAEIDYFISFANWKRAVGEKRTTEAGERRRETGEGN
ncbi:MAG: TolC family protein [Calditrichaeota bacterium]|nr:TolC family protein [Calditrichota bacterium]